MKKNNPIFYIGFVGAMLIFSTIGIIRRYIPLSSSLLALTRGILGAAFLIIFVKIRKRKIFNNLNKKDLILLIIAGILMGFNWILLFEAYNYTSVAVATLCYYMEPTILILLSPIIFKEKLTTKKIICVILALIGMIFVAGFKDITNIQLCDLKGILCGLGAGILYASVVIISKKVEVKDVYTKTITELLSATLILLPYVLITEDFSSITLTTTSVILVLVVGIFHTGIAYALYFGCMQRLKSQTVAILSYIDPLGSLILSAIILNESLSLYGIMGAILIIGSTIISEIE